VAHSGQVGWREAAGVVGEEQARSLLRIATRFPLAAVLRLTSVRAGGPAAARLTSLAQLSVATVRLDVGESQTLRARLEWSEPTPTATLARRVALELGEIDVKRLKRCEQPACDLVFYDTTRSGTRRWHAESPCGARERQRRYRAAARTSSATERR
jgi:predicted RNA-binding Zn ribbon-like protein